MGIPKFIGTGNADTDAQVIQADKSGASSIETVKVTGQTRAVTITISHRLGRTPTAWRVTREQPDTGVTGRVTEAADGLWTDNTVELTMPGNGTWDIEFS